MAIHNAGLSTATIGLGLGSGSENSFRFCFFAGQFKKQNKMILANSEAERQVPLIRLS